MNDEPVPIEQWAQEHKAKVDRFVRGYNSDRKMEGEESAIPETMRMEEWESWLRDFI